jgi:hypothetical protein
MVIGLAAADPHPHPRRFRLPQRFADLEPLGDVFAQSQPQISPAHSGNESLVFVVVGKAPNFVAMGQAVEVVAVRYARTSSVVLAMGPGNLPTVRVGTRNTVWFCFRTVQQPNLLDLSGPNPYPYPSTRGICWVWLDLLVSISGSVFRVFHLLSHLDILLGIAQY